VGDQAGQVVGAPAGAYGVHVEDPDHDSTEKARYAPRENRNKRRWPTVMVALLASLVVVGATFWGVRVYSSSRYFIAAADGQIGIYNGLPGSLLGHEMNTLVERRDTRISDLPVFFQRQVANTIGFSDLASARDAATSSSPTPNPTPTPPRSCGGFTVRACIAARFRAARALRSCSVRRRSSCVHA